jgi:hypothetical protein
MMEMKMIISQDTPTSENTEEEKLLTKEGISESIPETDANLISRLSFHWSQPLINLGKKKILTESDLENIPNVHHSKNIDRSFHQTWEKFKEISPKRQIFFFYFEFHLDIH